MHNIKPHFNICSECPPIATQTSRSCFQHLYGGMLFSLKTKPRHLNLCNLLMTLSVLIRPGHCEQSRRAERQCQGRDTGEERVRGDRGGHGAGPAQRGAGQQRGWYKPVGPPRHSL